MSGRYVEAGDGYYWVEDVVNPLTSLSVGAKWAQENQGGLDTYYSNIKKMAAQGTLTPETMQQYGISPQDISNATVPTTTVDKLGVNAPSSIRADLASNQEYLNAMASSGETGRTTQEIQSTLAPIVRDLGNGMQGSYSPVTGELQNIYSSSNTGGRYDTKGNFIPFDKPSTFFGGLYEAIADMPGNIYQGLSDTVESDTFQTMAPAVIGGIIGSGAFGGELFGAAAATDASFLAADAAQLAAQGLSEAAIAQNLGAYGSQAAASLAASMAVNGLDTATMTQQLNNLGTNTGLMSQTGSAADFAAADALQLQGQVGNNFAAIEQNLIASGVDPLIAADISNQIAMNPGLTQAQLATNISNNFGSNIYDVNAAQTYPTSILPGQGGLLSDAAAMGNTAAYTAPAAATGATAGAGTTAAAADTAAAGTGLSSSQIANLIKAGVSLAGIGGAAGALGGSSQGGAGTFVAPTQQQAAYTPEYYNQLQQYYNAYMPQTPRDVVTPLQQWYNTPKVA